MARLSGPCAALSLHDAQLHKRVYAPGERDCLRIRPRQFGYRTPLKKLCKRRKLGIERASFAQIVERARQIKQVAGLAVAMPEARKYAEHLQMPLHADEIKVAQELSRGSEADPPSCEHRAIACDPACDARTRPSDVAVLQERYQVITDRTVQCVLKIDDARISLPNHHEVARVIVTMDEHLRLSKSCADQKFEGAAQYLFLGCGWLESQMPATKPFRHQRKLACECLAVIGRKLLRCRAAAHLDVGEHTQSIRIQRVGVSVRLELLQIRPRA